MYALIRRALNTVEDKVQKMVEGDGIEPTSSGFSDQRSDLISYPSINGGGYGNRTHLNILLARQATTP